MAIVVNSPFSGKPVKIRDQDLGRAVRDEDGRIFYVLDRSDGEGYYSSPTRQGGEKDQQRYDAMASKEARTAVNMQQQQAAHDATGRRRGSLRGKLVILVLFLIVLALAWYAYTELLPKWNKGPEAGTMPLSLIEREPFDAGSGEAA